MFCTYRPLLHGYCTLFLQKHFLGDLFDRLRKPFFPRTSVYIQSQFRGRMTGEGLGIPDGNVAIENEVDIGHAKGVEVQLALGCVLG